MWGGAVNRQPGYRARNLQRRGFPDGMLHAPIYLLRKNIFSQKNKILIGGAVDFNLLIGGVETSKGTQISLLIAGVLL